jgi:hypothetical protein
MAGMTSADKNAMPFMGPFPSVMVVLGYWGQATVVLTPCSSHVVRVCSPSEGSANSSRSCRPWAQRHPPYQSRPIVGQVIESVWALA